MKVETALLGSVDVKEEQRIQFKDGLPGFEDTKDFVLLDVGEGLPYKWLQSVEHADLSLLLATPFVFYPAYEWQLPAQVLEELEIEEESQVEVWTVVTMAAELERATINLLAPIVLNAKTRAAVQIILHDSGYQTKHPLIPAVVLAEDPTEGEG